MIRSTYSGLGIRSRALLMAVLPVLFITLLLGYYLISVQLDSATRLLHERGELLSRYLASSSEFALFSGDRETLQIAANAALREADVYSVTISTTDGLLVVKALSALAETSRSGSHSGSELLFFNVPVVMSGVPMDPLGEDGQVIATTDFVLGAIEVIMHQGSVKQQKQEDLRNAMGIVLLALLLSLLLVQLSTLGLVRPILRLNQAVKQLGAGNLSARVTEQADGELGQLAAGFNSMAAQLQGITEELERRVGDATEELRGTVAELEQKNVQLVEAREKALKAGQEKTQFLANMSHEIRTPINAVIGFTSLLKKAPVDKTQAEYIGAIDQAGRQLTAIIDDILDFSKLEAGSVTIERIAFPPRSTLEDVIMLLRPAVHEKRLELSLNIEAGMPGQLVGDPGRLRQILTNLVCNAVKFTPEGTVDIQVRYANQRGELRVDVIDSGIGISEEQQQRLFKDFSQGDASISRRFGGSGLGLVISYRLISLMGGQIGMRSSEGEGSHFWFELPMPRVAEPSSKPTPLPEQGMLLLCEEHLSTRRAIAADLELLGFRSEAVPAFQQALEMLAHAGQDGESLYQTVVLGVSGKDATSETLVDIVSRVREVYAGRLLLLVSAQTSRLSIALGDDPLLQCLPKPLKLSALSIALTSFMGVAPSVDCPGETLATADVQGLRVLVVEDNVFNRKLMAATLSNLGIEVGFANNGREALDELSLDMFDLVLMDIHMPVMDGLEAIRRIRAGECGDASIPVIALTADVFIEKDNQLTAAGFDEWLHKPISEEALLPVLERRAGRRITLPTTVNRSPNGADNEHNVTKPAVPAALQQRLREELETLSTAIKTAHEDGNSPELYKNVHDLLGISGLFKMSELTRLAAWLESKIKDGEEIDAPAVGCLLSQVELILASDW